MRGFGWVQEELSAEELARAVTEAGYPTTPRQLERWRGPQARLLPPSTPGIPAVHTRADIQRCVAIRRCLAVKDDLKHAREVLWASGFEMPREMWRPAINKWDRFGSFLIRRLYHRYDFDTDSDAPTFGDQVAEQDRLDGFLYKLVRRLGDSTNVATFSNAMLQISAGEFFTFEHEEPGQNTITTKQVLLRGLGFEDCDSDVILGHRMNSKDVLQSGLSNVAAAYRGPGAQDFSDEELCTARDDTRNALKMAYCLHQAVSWFLGKEALGLQFAATFAKMATLPLIAVLTPAMARLRRVEGAIHASATIAQMAAEAEAAWLMSNYFFELQRDRSEFREICGPRAMKLAFRDSVSHGHHLRSISLREFPKPDFRPWDLWNSTSKTKKMPTGLLVMSTGAPSRIALEDAAQLGNASASR